MTTACVAAGFSFTVGQFFAGIAITIGIAVLCLIAALIYLLCGGKF